MSLTVFNGSPRGQSSNSTVITQWFIDGYTSDITQTIYLNKRKNMKDSVDAFRDSHEILMVFPLYVDGMPGQVKDFMESLRHISSEIKDKKITFIIHSGFTEAIHSHALADYLSRFSQLLNLNNQGVIIIPGSEGFRLMPPQMTKKKSQALGRIAKSFSQGDGYNPRDLKVLAPKEKMSTLEILAFRFFSLFGLTNLYWNNNLKNNNAYKQRFDAPYDNNPVAIKSGAHLKNY